MHRILEKFNISDPLLLNNFYRLQYQQFDIQSKLLKEQMLTLEKSLYPSLIPNEDIQRLLWIPGIGKMNAFTILLEVGDINRFETEKNFFSYCRLVPSARNSAGKTKQRSSKDGNLVIWRYYPKLYIKLPKMMVRVFISQIASLLFCYFTEKWQFIVVIG